MTAAIAPGLDGRHLIDITTTGRRSGLAAPDRDRRSTTSTVGCYISGMPSPRKRAWIANLEADPRMTVHVKAARGAAGPAGDRPRRSPTRPSGARSCRFIAANWRRTDVDRMVEFSPLIEVTLD